MEKKSDNRVCMDNKAGFENSNLLNPVVLKASNPPIHLRVSRISAPVVKCVVK
jgi:hypothetical protein